MIEVKGDPKEVLEILAEPMFAQGAQKLFVAACCGRLYVGLTPAKGCRGCNQVPENKILASLEGVSDLLDHLDLT